VRIESGHVTVLMKQHHSTAESARAIVEPFLQAWELQSASASPNTLRALRTTKAAHQAQMHLWRQLSPLLRGLPPYRWCLRILDLDPMLSTAGAVSGAEPLRYDAFAAEPAGMLEDFGAVAAEMLVQD
jgi:hypothetical protein